MRAVSDSSVPGWSRRWWLEAGAIVKAMRREWRDDRVAGLAAEVAFFGLLGLFPTLLVLAAALGSMEVIVGGEVAARAEGEVLDFLRRVLTDEASGTIDAVRRLFVETEPGLFTFGLLASLWAASRTFGAVVNALDVAYDLEERRSWLNLRASAIGLALGTAVVGAVILAMLVVGPLLGTGRHIADAIGAGGLFAAFWDWLRWPTVSVLIIAWASTIFHLAPNHRTPWRWDVPGAVLTAVFWALASVGFRFYLSLAAGANQVLGTLGGSLIVLLWLYLMSIGLLLGGELNAVVAHRYSVPQRRRRPLSVGRRRR